MKRWVDKLLKGTPLYYPVYNRDMLKQQAKDMDKWEASGRGVPVPHVIKQQTLREHAQKFNLKVLVETGTFMGDMMQMMRDDFETLYSIELSKELNELAKKRFAGVGHIELLQGDSGDVLGELMPRIDQPTLFWLDGHYSGGFTAKGVKETPIYEEISHILDAADMGHVMIVDDARCFGSDKDYPTIEEFKEFVLSKRPELCFEVKFDAIRITPNAS